MFDPRAGKLLFRTYAEEWLAGRRLAPMTRDSYEQYLRRHLYPAFGETPLNRITPAEVRRWHRQLADRLPPSAAKAYRIFRSILATAVDDQLLARNPCAIRGAGNDRVYERPFVPADVVLDLAEAAHPRLRAMILVAGFCGLRYGELRALRVRHYDRLRAVLVVEEAVDKKSRRKEPKTEAGRRRVAVPRFVLDAIDYHLAMYPASSPEAPLFPGEAGGIISEGWFKREWTLARQRVAVRAVRFHDLRHTAGTLAAQQGSTLKEVMARLGHSTTAAAIRYQRAAESRDRELAQRLDALVVSLSHPSPRDLAGWTRDEIDDPAKTGLRTGPDLGLLQQPQRDSNPCRHLERVVS